MAAMSRRNGDSRNRGWLPALFPVHNDSVIPRQESSMASSSVTQIPPAPSEAAQAHFAHRLSLETDCADVHEAMSRAGGADFVLLDVRGPQSYARAHVPGAINLPHRQIGTAPNAADIC
jgi:Rhodanese-like domain